MNTSAAILSTLTVLLWASCAAPQPCRPFQFLLTPSASALAPGAALAPAQDPSPVPLLQALRAQQLALGQADERTGVFTTRWEDIGAAAAPLDGRPTHLWRRYQVKQAHTVSGLLITVTAEARRCADARTQDGVTLVGACVPEALPSAQQRELDLLGAQFQQALAPQVGATPLLPTAGPGIQPPLPPGPGAP